MLKEVKVISEATAMPPIAFGVPQAVALPSVAASTIFRTLRPLPLLRHGTYYDRFAGSGVQDWLFRCLGAADVDYRHRQDADRYRLSHARKRHRIAGSADCDSHHAHQRIDRAPA